jgi:hypothetical protein
MDLVDKIVITRKFNMSMWLVPALNALVQHEKSHDFLEGTRLGMDWVLKVVELRDGDSGMGTTTTCTCQYCNHTGPPCCNSCSSMTANRCGSCNTQLTAAMATSVGGNRRNVHHSDKIWKAFGLAHRHLSPYMIKEKVGLSYRLCLPPTLHHLWPVFSVTKWTPAPPHPIPGC